MQVAVLALSLLMVAAVGVVPYCITVVVSGSHVIEIRRTVASLVALENPDAVVVDLVLNVDIGTAAEDLLGELEWPHRGTTTRLNPHSQNLTAMWPGASAGNYVLFVKGGVVLSSQALRWVEATLLQIGKGKSSPLGPNAHRIKGIGLTPPMKLRAIPIKDKKHRPLQVVTPGRHGPLVMVQQADLVASLFFYDAWREMALYGAFRDTNYRKEIELGKVFHIPESEVSLWSKGNSRWAHELLWVRGWYLAYPSFVGGGGLAFEGTVSSETMATEKCVDAAVVRYVIGRIGFLGSGTFTVASPFVDLHGRLVLEGQGFLDTISDLSDPAVQSSLGSLTKRKQETGSFDAFGACKTFSRPVSDFVTSNSWSTDNGNDITIVASTMDRFDILVQQIEHFSGSVRVKRIVVVLHDVRMHKHKLVPHTGFVGQTEVLFETVTSDSLNNRFMPSHLITTDAVLIIDDDMKVSLPDLHLLHETWKKYPRQVNGFAPRFWDYVEINRPTGAETFLRYVYHTGDPILESPKGGYKGVLMTDIQHTGYGLILTKVMMIHRTYLHDYVCRSGDEERRREHILAIVDRNMNCEDIAMNLVVAMALDDEPSAMFVYPLEPVVDYGRLRGGGISDLKSHQSVRTKCLNAVNDVYKRATSGRSLPVQHKLVRTAWNRKKNMVLMWEDALVGRPRRVHVDCLNTTYSWGHHICLWPKKTDVTGPRFRWDEAAVQQEVPLQLHLPFKVPHPPASPGSTHYKQRASVNFDKSYMASLEETTAETHTK